MPGRAILNPFLQQIKDGVRPAIKNLLPVSGTLRYQNHSLLHHKGIGKCSRRDEDNALLFCGSNAYRAEKIEKVDDVMKELVGEL